jgi:hypothetical protein
VPSDTFVSQQWDNTEQLLYSEYMPNVLCASNMGKNYNTVTWENTLEWVK